MVTVWDTAYSAAIPWWLYHHPGGQGILSTWFPGQVKHAHYPWSPGSSKKYQKMMTQSCCFFMFFHCDTAWYCHILPYTAMMCISRLQNAEFFFRSHCDSSCPRHHAKRAWDNALQVNSSQAHQEHTHRIVLVLVRTYIPNFDSRSS